MSIVSRIIRTEPIKWRTIPWLQRDDFKTISKSAFEKLKTSLKSNGFVAPFFCWDSPDGVVILDGTNRKRAMLELETEGNTIPDELPANFVQCKDRKEALKLVLVYSSIYAKATEESLYEMIMTEDLDFSELKMEIDLPEINMSRFEVGYMTPDVVEDEAPEPPVNPRTVKGDLYELGNHRLLCGDSTNSDDVARLMDGKRAGLCATDPPYLVGYNEIKRPNDSQGTHEEYHEIDEEQARKFFELAVKITRDEAAFYWWHAHRRSTLVDGIMRACGILIHQEIVWVKPSPVMGYSLYLWQHEPCMFGFREGFTPRQAYSEINSHGWTTVWQFDWQGKARHNSKNHPTEKPIEIFARPMKFHTKRGDLCYEPFAGSGSQFIAAEQTGRICYGVEISEAYNDVIVSRWCSFTKQNKVKLNGTEIEWPSI